MKTSSFLFLVILLAAFASCNENGSNQTTTDPQQEPQVDSVINIEPFAPTKTIDLSNFESTGSVYDVEEILTKNQEIALDSALQRLKRQTSVEVMIISIDASLTTETDFNDYTLQIMANKGLGQEKENGLMIAFSTGLHKIRINKGTAIAKFFPDSESQHIIDEYMIPDMAVGDYYLGLNAALNVITPIIMNRCPKEWLNE